MVHWAKQGVALAVNCCCYSDAELPQLNIVPEVQVTNGDTSGLSQNPFRTMVTNNLRGASNDQRVLDRK